ncbi:MAG: DNA-3-methyladenine glycosylase [Vicinamibacterales bacterium]
MKPGRAASGQPLARAFYARPTLVVARELIGAVLVHDGADGRVAARIVEVEAYVGESDPACHAAPGPTPRNAPLYGPPGRAYVYLNYGMHCLLNAVTEEDSRPAAVLIRAAEPLDGLALMRRRRTRPGTEPPTDVALCRGPGNLGRAFGITLAENTCDLTSGPLTIVRGDAAPAVRWTPRIGLTRGQERHWRCVAAESRAVSGPRAWVAEGLPGPRPARAVADRRGA